MKKEIRLALLCMAAVAVPAFAQGTTPLCGSTNFDSTRNVFTIVNPAANTVNQQCFITVYQSGTMPSEAWKSPGSYIVEGTYLIELVGGGGGGGGGSSKDAGGGGGGAGAAPLKTSQYLSPGVYKLTIGTGGTGGSANGGWTGDGNPTSLTNAHTGQLIAGFPGADIWTQRSRPAGDGHGGRASAGGSRGGSGGDSGPRSEEPAQPGGALQTPGYYGVPGQAGSESGRSAKTDGGRRVVQANAGGGGGASVGSGGTGKSAERNGKAEAGEQGGHGFIKLSMTQAAPQAIAPVFVPAPVLQRYSLSTDALFAFGKYDLKPEGQAKLDDMLNRLRDVNIDRITDTGHADRIGSSESNQILSENRAESVKAYLVSRGIQSNRITALGKGETEPVTGSSDCKGPATPQVISCLQPDRRVDIDVVGTSK